MRIAALMLIALALAACDGPTISIKSGEGDNASVFADGNGAVAIKAPGFEGSFKLPKMRIKTEDFDVDGVKLYPGSTIAALDIDAKGGDAGQVRVRFDSPAALATIQQWFREKMAAQGFTVAAEGNGLKGTTKDGEAFNLTLDPDGPSKTKGQLVVSNRG